VRHGVDPGVHVCHKGRRRVIVAIAKNQANYMFLVLPSDRSKGEGVRVPADRRRNERSDANCVPRRRDTGSEEEDVSQNPKEVYSIFM
jgi:hypothetical protein